MGGDDPLDGLGLVGDAPQFVAAVGDAVEACAVVVGLVARQLTESVIGALRGGAAQGGACDETALLGDAGEGESARPG
jgi:hypothetical protein